MDNESDLIDLAESETPILNPSESSTKNLNLGHFNTWYLKEHFKVTDSSNNFDRINVQCLLCLPKPNILVASKKATSNLL